MWSWTTNFLCCGNAHGVRIIRYEPYAQATPDQVHKMDRATAVDNGNTGRHWATFSSRFAETRNVETLFERPLIPACSRAFLKGQGAPGARRPARLAAGRCCTACTGQPVGRTGRRRTEGAEPVAGIELPALQGDGDSGERGHGRRPRPRNDDRPRTRARNAGLPARLPGHRVGAVRADHDVSVTFSDRRDKTQHVETPIDETLLPVCSSAVVRGSRRAPRTGGSTQVDAAVRPAVAKLPTTRNAQARATARTSGTRLPTWSQSGRSESRAVE